MLIIIFGIIVFYFLVLIFVLYFIGCKVGNVEFFLVGCNFFWLFVVIGMIGVMFFGVIFIFILGVVGVGGEN